MWLTQVLNLSAPRGPKLAGRTNFGCHFRSGRTVVGGGLILALQNTHCTAPYHLRSKMILFKAQYKFYEYHCDNQSSQLLGSVKRHSTEKTAVSNRWTGLLEWTTGMDYWNGL